MLPKIRKVIVDQKILQGFKRRALQAYPLELLEIMSGDVEGSTALIHAFLPIEQEATDMSVDVCEDFDGVKKIVERLGMKFIGTIHSHTEIADTSPSKSDRVSAIEDKELVSGIVAIHQSSGKRRRCLVDFYAPSDLVELEITSPK